MTKTEFEQRLELFDNMMNQWHPWESKIAWWPMKVRDQWIWLRRYYERCPMFFPDSRVERVLTVLDMLK